MTGDYTLIILKTLFGVRHIVQQWKNATDLAGTLTKRGRALRLNAFIYSIEQHVLDTNVGKQLS